MSGGSNNEVTLTVPTKIFEDGDSVIDLDTISKDSVTIHRNRKLSSKKTRKGERKVLAILVQDKHGNKPHQSEDQMSRDLFGIDDQSMGNNLVRIFVVPVS